MSIFLLFGIFAEINIGGIQYNEGKTVLIKVYESSISELSVPASVQIINAGSVESSAFYECRNNIRSVTFEPNS